MIRDPSYPVTPYTRTTPRRPSTGLSNEKCYAAVLNDCDAKISAEHYISESLLKQMGSLLLVTSPRPRFEAKKLSPASLTAKILCTRHNSALSGLDTSASNLFRFLKQARARPDSGGGADGVNGYDVERWLLKVLCGFVTHDRDVVPESWVRLLFGHHDILSPRGLNMNVREGEAIDESVGLIFETARNASAERAGCAVTLLGFRFLLSLDGRRVYGIEDLGKESLYRPGHIRWVHGVTKREYVVGFTWYPRVGDGLKIEAKHVSDSDTSTRRVGGDGKE